MSFPVLEQLEAITAKAPSEGELKLALSRVAMEVNARYQSGAASSAEFMDSVITTLKALPGPAHAELRINCLIDASHFFYLNGQTFNAIDPADDAV